MGGTGWEEDGDDRERKLGGGGEEWENMKKSKERRNINRREQ